MDCDGNVGEDLASLLESTVNISKGLETLYSEHEALLEALRQEEREGETGKGERESEGSQCTLGCG